MLSGEAHENGEKTATGLISKKTILNVQHTFSYISLPFFCTTTTWNFQKLPGYTFFWGKVVLVFVRSFFSRRSLHPGGPEHFSFSYRRYKISCCSSNKKCLLCFFSLAPALFLIELRWPVALLSLFLCLSVSLYSKFLGMTINLSLYFRQHGQIQKHFPLSVFVFLDSLVVFASQDAGALPRQTDYLTFINNYHRLTCSGCTDGGRSGVMGSAIRPGHGFPICLTHGAPLRARERAPLLRTQIEAGLIILLRWCYTRRFATTIFSATQRCSIVATLFRMVRTLFQHCNSVLR